VGRRDDVAARGESVGRRIRDGEVAKVPYLLVVGDREADSETVSARARGEGDLGAMPLEELAGRLADEARGG
jgi:threonyl-tRNA synthetase